MLNVKVSEWSISLTKINFSLHFKITKFWQTRLIKYFDEKKHKIAIFPSAQISKALGAFPEMTWVALHHRMTRSFVLFFGKKSFSLCFTNASSHSIQREHGKGKSFWDTVKLHVMLFKLFVFACSKHGTLRVKKFLYMLWAIYESFFYKQISIKIITLRKTILCASVRAFESIK